VRHDAPTSPITGHVNGGPVREVLDCLEGLILDGLGHGFFDCAITCEIGNGGRRQLVIRAGKSHKFTIPAGQVPR
jgi:hypothetical protein